ncbi:MAG: extracellular solute-binding protein [Eubacteriales bacterium]|nr:extracellular solute-binding protein [Eubacteriales bacterium]
MKKLLALVLTLALSLTCFVAFAEEDVTLSIAFHYPEEYASDIITEFEAAHPGVKVEYNYFQITDEELITRLVGGEYWDVGLVPKAWGNAELTNYYMDLGSSAQWADQYYFGDFRSYEGETYALPIGVVYEGLLYNQAVLDQYNNGVMPNTLDDFMALCQVLKDNGVIPVWCNGGSGWAMRYWTNLAATITEDADYANQIALAKDPWAEGSALRTANAYLETFAKNGWLEPDVVTGNQWDTSTASLSLGQTAFILTGTWAVDNARSMAQSLDVNPENIKFAAFPYKNDVSADSPLWLRVSEDLFCGVSNKSEHPELAKELLTFFCDHIANAIGMNGANKETGKPVASVEYLASIDYYLLYSPSMNDAKIEEYANNCGIDLYAYDNYLLDYVVLPALESGTANWDGLNEAWNKNFQ